MIHPFLLLNWLENHLHTHFGEHVMYTWLVMLVLIVLAFITSRRFN